MAYNKDYELPEGKKYCLFCTYYIHDDMKDIITAKCIAHPATSYVGTVDELPYCKDVNKNGDCDLYKKKEKNKEEPKKPKKPKRPDNVEEHPNQHIFDWVEKQFTEFKVWLNT